MTVLEETGAVGLPDGGVPRTEAVFTTEPAFRSVSVTVWLPVQVVATPGARVVNGHEIAVTLGSVTATEVSVTLPVLRTVNV